MIEAAFCPDVELIAIHKGLELMLPNASVAQVDELPGMVLNVQFIPSGLVAHAVLPVAITTNCPCPYLILDHVCVDGKPTP